MTSTLSGTVFATYLKPCSPIRLWTPLAPIILASLVGCGTIREKRATEQLLLSDAVDRSVANIDFSPLAEEKVYLDTRFMQFQNDSSVTTNYVVSALRQQMIVAGCLLQDSMDNSTYIVEARVGTLGADGHEINYGVPASGTVNAAASLVTSSPLLPSLPEISLAKRVQSMAAAKIAVFAYERDSRRPIWQSGTSLARSEASGTWLLGAGPFKRGAIYDGRQFAGNMEVKTPIMGKDKSELLARDYVYRGTTIWDTKVRERVESGFQKDSLPSIATEDADTSQEEVVDGEERVAEVPEDVERE